MRRTILALALLLAALPADAQLQTFAADPACSAGAVFTYVNSTTGVARKCVNGTISNVVAASEIETTGTLPPAIMPLPTSSTLGGAKSLAASANNFFTGLGTDGIFTRARPACADLSNAATSCSTDATNASNLSTGVVAAARGGTGAAPGADDQVNVADSTSAATWRTLSNGAVKYTTSSNTFAQAACADLSNAAASCATDATNAANITSGSLPAARIASATITNAMMAATSYTKAVFVATCSGTATASSTLYLFPIGQISAFTCTVTTPTSGIPMPTAGTLKNLTFKSGTGGKAGDAVTILKNASATGMPTCVYGTASTCADTSTAGAVVAGDLITVKIATTTSDTTANVHVSFELWN